MGRCAAELLAADQDAAVCAREQALDCHQRGGLPGPVATEQRDGLALADRQVQVEDDMRLAVADVEAGDLEDSYAVSSSSPR